MDTPAFHFRTEDDAIKMLTPGYYMADIDLHHSYRSVPIHPSNVLATGLKRKFVGEQEFTYLDDTRLPFGAKCSPEKSSTG